MSSVTVSYKLPFISKFLFVGYLQYLFLRNVADLEYAQTPIYHINEQCVQFHVETRDPTDITRIVFYVYFIRNSCICNLFYHLMYERPYSIMCLGKIIDTILNEFPEYHYLPLELDTVIVIGGHETDMNENLSKAIHLYTDFHLDFDRDRYYYKHPFDNFLISYDKYEFKIKKPRPETHPTLYMLKLFSVSTIERYWCMRYIATNRTLLAIRNVMHCMKKRGFGGVPVEIFKIIQSFLLPGRKDFSVKVRNVIIPTLECSGDDYKSFLTRINLQFV